MHQPKRNIIIGLIAATVVCGSLSGCSKASSATDRAAEKAEATILDPGTAAQSTADAASAAVEQSQQQIDEIDAAADGLDDE